MAAFKWWTSPPYAARHALCLALTLSVSGITPSAWALPNDACIKDERCKEHHDKAVKYYSEQYYEEALSEFQAAYAARQMSLLLINIGRSLQKLGRPKEALSYYERFQQVEANPEPTIAAKVNDYIAQAKALIGTQPATPPPGPVSDGAAKPPSGPPPPTPPPPGRNLIIAGSVIAGVGLIGIATGIGLYTRSASDYATFQGSTDELDQRLAKSSAQSYGLGSVLGYSLGAVVLAAGGAVIGLGAAKLIKHRRSPATPAARAALLPGLGGATVVLTGEY